MFTIAIQAGGASSRMGSNKVLLPFLGSPLIERIINRLSPIADEIFVVCNQPELFGFLDIPVHPDIMPGIGPLGGLLSALVHASHPIVGNLACDMPFINPDLVKAQVDLICNGSMDVVIPWVDEQYEPLHAVYRRETCLPHVRNAVEEGSKRVISWFPSVRIHKMSAASIYSIDPQGLSFTNVNTAKEFIEAEDLARRIEPGY